MVGKYSPWLVRRTRNTTKGKRVTWRTFKGGWSSLNPHHPRSKAWGFMTQGEAQNNCPADCEVVNFLEL